MKRVSVRKLSVLGLVLMAASAVTAAVLPSTSKGAEFEGSADNGTVRDFSGGGGVQGVVSCVNVTGGLSCHVTADSATGVDSEDPGFRTAGNTSVSTPGDGVDTTSVVS